MRIGILTFHRPSNFGANLQAYSSVSFFSSLGYMVKIIDYTRPVDLAYKESVNERQFLAHKHFIEQKTPLTRQVFNEEDLCEVVRDENFDVILIGADAVWRVPQDNCIYFAKWLFKDKTLQNTSVASISAAHMGNGYMDASADARQDIHNCLSKFKYITVRDKWTRDALNRDIFLNKTVVKVINPDPVIKLYHYIDDCQWQAKGQERKRYYLMTLPVEWGNSTKIGSIRRHWFSRFKKLVNSFGYQLVELPLPEGKSGMNFDFVVDYPIDPLQWFLWIKNAKAFCGLRFHAIVSSIANGTPFYSIDTYGKKTKKSLLLDWMGLHSLARKDDKHSKIRNLLQSTPFEAHRTGIYIEFENPRRVFNILEHTDVNQVLNMRNELELQFDKNISELIKHISYEC